ncbi:alpha-galactosidase [Streptomyces candidus]|uniref:Alpha-galactosidase n=1 Tax=Streptomyces candidus TaxID=67283 RepID=A0A7X0HEC2_9ACTN|nr:alpha-galactosidase [Streptomyces candidus]MBB6436045.1 alpha-galactosidase [Streptomyces candidus]GHH43455.1 alpha-galactosidase [Streptomyces candidus]
MTLAETDRRSGTVLLRAGGTCYVLRVDTAAGTVRLLHWGAPVGLADAVASAEPDAGGSSFHSPLDGTEELAVDGQVRFAPPALEVRYADGTGATEPVVDGYGIRADAGGAELSVRLRDADRPLGWDLHYRVRRDCPVIERCTVLRHTGAPAERPLTLLRHSAAQWNLPVLPAYRLSSVHGQWAGEFQLRRTPLAVGETTLTSRRGHTGHQSNPWLTLDAGDATEESGEVWTVALATAGSWRMTAVRSAEGRCSVLGGSGHEGVELSLAPGESWTTPVSTGLYAADGFGAASRAYHAYVREHVLPAPGEMRPVLYNSWEATAFDVTFEGQRELAALAARAGAELFVVDDGWFGDRDSDRAGLGDWNPRPAAFPEGLRPLSDHVHALGMRFGLWVEPEMVNPDSDLFRARPDWVLHLPDRTAHPLRHQLVLDFSRPEVTDWAFAWLLRTVDAFDVDFLKWDFNRSFTEAGSTGRRSDGRRVFVEHALGTHRVLDRLRAARPDLRIETCSGGGGRVDLASLARSDQAWVSDNTDAVDRLGIQYGFSQLYPAQVMGAWVTDSPNPYTRRAVPLRFRLHSAMAGALGLGGDLTRWTEADLAETAAYVARYKEVRSTVQTGDLYRLGSPADGSHAVQYVARDGGECVVLQWRAGPPQRGAVPRLRLRGLAPEAAYRVDDDSGALPAGTERTGAALAAYGWSAELPPAEYASRMLVVRRTR